MIVTCTKCGKFLKEGQEVEGVFRAFYHELGSKVHYAITKPHDYVPNTLCHVDCNAPMDGTQFYHGTHSD